MLAAYVGEANRAPTAWRNLALPCAVLVLSAMAHPAAANEFGGNFSWQFQSASDAAVRAATLEQVQKKKAGGYGSSSYTYNTYIAGDQVNCNVSASAIGNNGTTSSSGAASSPSLLNTPSILAQATGSSISSGWGGGAGALNAGQTNSSSPQSAGVSSTSSLLQSSGLQAQGGTLTQALNSTQSNMSSPQTASVAGSTACGQAGSTR